MSTLRLMQMATKRPDGIQELEPQLVAQFHSDEVLIDVREPHEYNAELGHIQGSLLVPMNTLPTVSQGWDKEKVYVLICRSGQRSARCAQYLMGVGFAHVANYSGGMIAHNAARLPIEKE